MDEKLKQKESLLIDLKLAQATLFDAEQAFHRARNNYVNLKAQYESLDREIAMETKRTIVTKAATKAPELTVDQIKAIADKLGIEIKDN